MHKNKKRLKVNKNNFVLIYKLNKYSKLYKEILYHLHKENNSAKKIEIFIKI
jgi:hypothetical protein